MVLYQSGILAHVAILLYLLSKDHAPSQPEILPPIYAKIIVGLAAVSMLCISEASAQASDHSATMAITARLMESASAHVTLMQPRRAADGLHLPAWTFEGAESDLQTRALLESWQHGPITVVFDASGPLRGAANLSARVFSIGNASDQHVRTSPRIPVPVVRLRSGQSIQLVKGSYYFDIIGDISVRDTSDGVYDAVVTLTLIYN